MQNVLSLGLLFPVSAGIQIDINPVRRADGSEGSVCDHNCTVDVGNYDCPAAFTKAKGLNKQFAPVAQILEWIMLGAEALQTARTECVAVMEGYFHEFRIPAELRTLIVENIRNGKTEVNIFGGNPEMHPEVLTIVAGAKKAGHIVNLTTTGRRFITDRTFTEAFATNPPNLLAVSADDIDLERLDYLCELDLKALKGAWKQVNSYHGQEQKFIEGIHAAKLFSGLASKVLFNMVVHRSNLAHAKEIITRIHQSFPDVLVNPYPAQSSFSYGGATFGLEHLEELERFVDLMIDWSKDLKSPITKRLHYWLLMKAVFNKHREEPEQLLLLLAGHDVWRCYQRPLLPYLQIGKSRQGTKNPGLPPGGSLDCFWNDQTISQSEPIRNLRQIEDYIHSGMKNISEMAYKPCPGCIMPRLMFNFVTTELGMNRWLIPNYLDLRKEHVGF